jgi:hypothetical protein
MKNALENRSKRQAALNELTAQIELLEAPGRFNSRTHMENFTIADWLKELEDSNNSKAAQAIRTLLTFPIHDGMFFSQTMPALMFATEVKRQSLGDCTTINVLKVPSIKLELVRALVEYPENILNILFMKMRAWNMDHSEIPHYTNELRKETYLPRDGERGIHAVNPAMKPVYEESDFASVPAPQTAEILTVETNLTDLSDILNAETTSIEKGAAILAALDDNLPTLTFKNYKDIFDFLIQPENNVKINTQPWYKPGIGKRYLGPWHEIAKMLRDEALDRLRYIMRESPLASASQAEKLNFLSNARNLPLFAEHRNSYIGGGWGRTHALQEIDLMIAEVRQQGLNNNR